MYVLEEIIESDAEKENTDSSCYGLFENWIKVAIEIILKHLNLQLPEYSCIHIYFLNKTACALNKR